MAVFLHKITAERLDKLKLTPQEKSVVRNLWFSETGEKVKNPYTGVEVELDPIAVAVYDCLKGAELTLHNNPEDETTLDLFYMMRDVFINNWPEHYTTLLD